MAADDTAARSPRQPEPTWSGFDRCDFCAQSLEAKDRLSGACASCAETLTRRKAGESKHSTSTVGA